MRADRARLERRIHGALDRGDLSRAATAAVEGYGPELLGYLVAVLRDDSVASDVFGDVCEDLWRGLAGFRRESTFRTWAYRIAWNAVQMHRRDPYRRRVRRLDTSEASRLAERLVASSTHRERRAAAERLARLRDSLAPDEQTLLILRVDRELSWDEIAQVLAGSDPDPPDARALRKRFERLKDRLVKLAEQES